MAGKTWQLSSRRRTLAVPEHEKQMVIAMCDRFIREVLQPKFLPAVVPTEWNYPVGIHGKWHGGRFRFVRRFRSDRPDAIAPEFDAPFARIEWVAPGLFDVSYHRYTGEWWKLFGRVRLEEALHLIETESLLQPL
jgi:hypothetical protein